LTTPSDFRATTTTPVTLPVNSNTTVNFGVVAQTVVIQAPSNASGNNSSSSTPDPNLPPGYYSTIMVGPHHLGPNGYIDGQGSAGGAMTLFPSGSVHDDLTIAITDVDPRDLVNVLPRVPFPWAQGINTAGELYKFQSTAAWNGMLIQTFDKPVTVLLPYDPARVGKSDPRKLRIAMFNLKTRRWQFLKTPMAVDLQKHTVATTVISFSYFSVGYARR
jgi:hypothetical protein